MAMAENRYSGGDMMSMQRDAIRRVREMQRRANEKLGQQASPQARQNRPSSSPAHTEHNHAVPVPATVPAEKVPQVSGLSSFLSNLDLDQEKIMLLMLLVLLIREGADTKLILALCYLLI